MTACAPAANPAPTFRTQVSLPANHGGDPEAVAIGDVTGDGRNDVIVSMAGSRTPQTGLLAVYPQTAVGTLGAARELLIPGPNRLDRFVLTDLDGDGRTDLLATGSPRATVYYQRNGMLTAPVPLPGSLANLPLSDLGAADLNGDKRTDLVVRYNEIAYVYLQQADRRFGARTMVGPWPAPKGTTTAVYLTDLNGDGRQDIVGGTNEGYWTSLALSGNRYAPEVTYTRISATYGVPSAGMAVGDVNGDGRGDVLQSLLSGPWQGVEVSRSASDGWAGGQDALPTFDAPAGVVVADVNKDNRRDILVAHANTGRVGLYTQKADGTMSPEQLLRIDYPAWGRQSFAVGDINGDGKADLVLVPGFQPSVGSVLYQR